VLCYYFFGRTSLVELSIAMLGGVVISNVIFLPNLVLKENYLFNKVSLDDFPFIKSFILSSGLFFIIQVAVYINQQVTLIFSANYLGNDAVTTFSFIFKFFMVAGGFVTMIFQPLWPAIHNAIAKKNIKWVIAISRKTKNYLVSYGFVICFVMLLFGEDIFSLWTNGVVIISPLTAYIVALYFVLICYTQSNVIVLMGLGSINKIAYITIIESVVVMLLLLALLPYWGVEGGMLALFIPKLLISCALLNKARLSGIRKLSLE
jgi:O-antigen/teichoic acid export membrane protein